MDRSPPLCDGEQEYNDPDLAKEYLLQPLRIREIQNHVEVLERNLVIQTENLAVQSESNTKFSENLELHFSVLTDMKKTLGEINKTLSEFSTLVRILVEGKGGLV
jgi:response regulator RpfG family c-di-GMP phosphodiesterase